MSRIAVLAALGLSAALVAQSGGAVELWPLPVNVTFPESAVSFPEGVALDPAGGALYTASAVDGVLVRIDTKTRAVTTVVPTGVLVPAGNSVFPASLGMKVDSAGRLWVAGGRTGALTLVDARSGKLLKRQTVPDPANSLINDVAVIGNVGYFTDTRSPTLWRVEVKGDAIGPVEPWLNFGGTALEYDSGANLNGIAATADGRTLIVVHMGKGLLFSIDLATKAVKRIDTGGADLTGADGLVLDGRTLYVVRQTAVEIATVSLSADLARGTVSRRFKDPQLAWPATAVKLGDRLIVVNTQFNTRTAKTQTLPFTLLSVPLAALAPQP